MNSPSKKLLLRGTFIFIVTTIIAIFLPLVVTKLSWINLGVDKPNEIGDTIGGILGPSVGILAAALTYLAFWAQYDANIEQRRQFDKTLKEASINSIKGQVEGRFFELLKIHIENRNNVMLFNKSIFDDLLVKLAEITIVLRSSMNDSKIKLPEYDIQNIAYSIFFYGPYIKTPNSNHSFQHIGRIIQEYGIEGVSNLTSNFFKTLEKILDKPHEELEKEFPSRQNVLSHYYRHLFQTVKYINDQSHDLFSYKEKYQYIKIIRAQLSTSEQILFFHNAISKFGKPWELGDKLDDNNKLITKYNLIKNIPIDLPLYWQVKESFPLVFFETDSEKSNERVKLEENYI